MLEPRPAVRRSCLELLVLVVATGCAPSIQGIDGSEEDEASLVADAGVRCTLSETLRVTLSTDRASAAANLAALHVAANTSRCVRVDVPGIYPIDGTFEPNADVCEDISLAPGVVLREISNVHLLRRRGKVDPATRTATSVVAGSATFRLNDTSGLAPGDWLMVRGVQDPIKSDGKSHAGSLRQIVSLTGTSVTVDRPFFRTMTLGVEANKVLLARTLRLHGGGTLEFEDPGSTQWSYLIFWQLTLNPRVECMELRNGGASGINYYATVGGHTFNTKIHNLIDDHGRNGWVDEHGVSHANPQAFVHYGYGHEVTAGARDLNIRGGSVWWVRHAFTTNHATLSPLGSEGEPEEISFSVNVHDTTSTGINTHEGGWNIFIHDLTVDRPGRYRAMGYSLDGKEDPGAVFIRNNNTFLQNVILREGPTLAIASSFELSPWLPMVNPSLTSVTAQGFGTKCVQMNTAVTLSNVTLTGCSGVGIQLVKGAATGSGLTIDTAAIGVLIAPGVTGSNLAHVQMANVSSPVRDQSGNTTNVIQLE